MASKNQRLRQRAQRRERRQIQARLREQSQVYEDLSPLPAFIDLNMSFDEFVLGKTKEEIKAQAMDEKRAKTIQDAINLYEKINPNVKPKSNNKIQILSTGFEQGKRR